MILIQKQQVIVDSLDFVGTAMIPMSERVVRIQTDLLPTFRPEPMECPRSVRANAEAFAGRLNIDAVIAEGGAHSTCARGSVAQPQAAGGG